MRLGTSSYTYTWAVGVPGHPPARFRYDPAAFGGASRDRFVAALEAEGIPCDGLFYEPVYRSTLFDVSPAEFPALGGRLREAASQGR